MRRAPIVIGATIAGTAGVLAFHPHAPAAVVATAPAAASTATPAPTATPAAGGSPTPTPTATATATAAARTATGDAVSTPYGDAQVRVTVDGGRITQIEALALQGNDPRSVQISSSAEPLLVQEALQAQSADVDVVSGATFTSASWSQSLQSALDKLGFEAADGSRATLQVPAGGGEEHGGGPGGP